MKLLNKLIKTWYQIRLHNKLISNTQPSTPDDRDYTIKTSKKLPNKHIIKNKLPIRSQGSIGSCFIAETPVLMEDYSYKPIKEISVGEKVITHKGNVKKVTNTFYRRSQAHFIKIKPFGIYEDIICTKEHPFLTQRGWIEAEKLTNKDYFFIPFLNEVKDNTTLDIEKDKEFLWVLGLYIAEGSIYKKGNSYRVSFSLHKKETDLADRITKFCSRFNIKTSINYKKTDNGMSVRFSNTYLASLLENLGGKYCDKKRIHDKLMKLNPELQFEIYKGWFAGDGTQKIIKGRHYATTTSLELAKQMQIILFRNGLFASVINKWTYKDRRPAYQVSFVEQKCDKNYRWYKSGDGFFVKINKLELLKQSKDGKQISDKGVYNLEVDDDNSYLVYGFSAHNCASHAIIRSVEYQQEPKDFIEGSELYHYYMVRRHIKNDMKDNGMTIRQAIQGLKQYGFCPEKLWEYNTKKYDDNPNELVKSFAELIKNFMKIKTYYIINNAEELRTALYNDIPVIFGMRIDTNFLRLRNAIYFPGGSSMGGHGMTIKGYDGDYFIVDNSWGNSWGVQGTCYIDSVTLFSKGFDFFAIITE